MTTGTTSCWRKSEPGREKKKREGADRVSGPRLVRLGGTSELLPVDFFPMDVLRGVGRGLDGRVAQGEDGL